MPMTDEPAAPDDDFLDGCQTILEGDEYDDAVVAALRPLFPGDLDVDVDELAAQWRELFADGIPPAGERTASRGRDTGIADRLRAAGCKVVEVAGWQTRGSGTFNPRGLTDHHTAGPRNGNAPSLGICINGRTGLPGPLCNIFTARDNTIFVVAAGRANHAGRGGWRGLSGNSSVYGNERENSGTTADPWRPDQHEAAARANAALLKGHADAANHCEHKEWAPSRKPDAHTVTGDHMRSLVRRFMADPTLLPQPPEVHPVTGSPRIAIRWTPTGHGYLVLFEDGGIANFGDAPAGLSVAGVQGAVKATDFDISPDGRGVAVLWENGEIDTREAWHHGEAPL